MGSCGSLSKLKQLYLQCHSVYGHQAGQDNDFTSATPTHKVTQSDGHLVLQDHGGETKAIIFPLPQ